MPHPTLERATAPSAQASAVFTSNDRSWSSIAAIDWAAEPLTDVARVVAGVARDCSEFYQDAHRGTARAIEAWLDRYSAAMHSAR